MAGATTTVEIPNYTLLEEIGASPLSRVYLAEWQEPGRRCALKLIDLRRLDDPGVANALKREADAAAMLRHDHVVTIHESGLTEDIFYLSMAFMEGGSLVERARTPMHWQDALRIANPLAEALAHAHERGLIHRGIQPANVLFDTDGRPALSDFGIARIIGRQRELTRTAVTVGADVYLAPEQVEGGGATPQSDLYALGVLLAEMLLGTGAPGSPGPAFLRRGAAIREVPAECGPVRPLLERLLREDPSERPGDARAVVEELQRVLEGTEASTLARSRTRQSSATTAVERPDGGETEPAVDASRGASTGPDGGLTIGVGSRIRDRFRIEAVLGEGGMGKVYYALDLLKEEAADEDPYVALKVLHPKIASAEINFMALQREARRSQDLAHPNIVTVFDLDRADGVVYMTMEMLRGKDSAQHIARHPEGLEPDEARSIIRDVAAGLAYAHERGITHADLKPQNVFICDDGRAKLLDFGIARAHRANKPDVVEEMFSGYTPAYASPEILSGEKAEPADDVYALGCIAYYYFTGRHPFDKKPATVARDEGLKPKRPAHIRRAEWHAITAALSFERSKRPSDATEFYRQFAPSRVKQVAAAVSVFSIAVAVALGLILGDRSGPETPFDELPFSTQAQINRNLEDASLFRESGDLNAALQLYDSVLRLHPGNRRGTDGMKETVEQVLASVRESVRSGTMRPEDASATLDNLLAYNTLPESVRRQVKETQSRL